MRADTYTSLSGQYRSYKNQFCLHSLLRLVLKLLPFVLPKIHSPKPPSARTPNSSLQCEGRVEILAVNSAPNRVHAPAGIKTVREGFISSPCTADGLEFFPVHSAGKQWLGFLYSMSQYLITGVVFLGNMNFWSKIKAWKQISVAVPCKQVCVKVPNMDLMLPGTCWKVCLL